jgi:hypothetical protein
VRYLTLAEALTIAEAVTGIDAGVWRVPRGLNCSTLHFMPRRQGLAIRSSIPRSSTRLRCWLFASAATTPLPDGNKRLAWQALTMFCVLNGFTLEVPPDDAVVTMLAIAGGDGTRLALRHGCQRAFTQPGRRSRQALP